MSASFKTAIVTGASKGLGRAIAIELGRAGMAVLVAARTAEALETVAGDAKAAGAPDALAFPADLTEQDAPARAVARAVEAWGRLDVLVNNAGDTKRGDFLTLADEDHLSGFALKYHATVRFCRAAWPHLVDSAGSIVNISGIGAHTPARDFTIGGPVNSALINFSKALSKRAEGGKPRVNVVCPGAIETERLTKRIKAHAAETGLDLDAAREAMRIKAGVERYGRPQDIADMVRFLCSDAASYVHGTVVTVDGGATPGI